MSVHYNGRSQSSDGESLPDDVFHDDSNVGVASGSQAPPTSSVPPPKPPRVSGSSGGIASFINKNTKKLKKRTSSEDLEESSKSNSSSKGGVTRRWSFKSGKSKRQQSVPVDMKLAESKGQSRAENGSVSGLTGDETGQSSSMSVSPLPSQGNDDTSPTEATPTASTAKPRPLASSSTHNNNNKDLETVHENVVSADSRPPVKPTRQTSVPSRQISTGTGNESKPSPKPRQKQQSRTKLFSDSQVLTEESKSSETLMEGEKSIGGESSSKGPGKGTLERDNMLLREQVKLLKGQNQKLKEQNKQYRYKLQDNGEVVTPATSSASHSESVSPTVLSPWESLPSSHGSSREPSSSPARDVFERNHSRPSDLTVVATSGALGEDREKKDEDNQLPRVGEDLENSEELNDVPQSLPSSSDVRGRTAAAASGVSKGDGFRANSVPNMVASKQKPVPIPRSGTVSVGGSGAVVKAGSDDKTTHGFIIKKGKAADVDDSVPSNAVDTVRLESVVSKVDSPVPKPRVNTNLSQVYAGATDDDCSTGEKSQGNLKGNDDSNKEKDKEKSNARRTLETLLPHLPKQTATSKPSPHLRSMSTQDREVKKEPLTPRAASLSPMGKVGVVTLGSSSAEKGDVISESEAKGGESEIKIESGLERVDEERVVEGSGGFEEEERSKERTVSDLSKSGGSWEEREEKDERTESMSSNKSFTSSISSVGKGSPLTITKPLPPTPAVVAKSPSATSTKPLPLTPPTVTKPLPPTPTSSTSKSPTSSSVPAKPLPPTPPTSSSVPAKPLPPTPPTSSPVPPKPLPPTPTSTSSKSLAPIKVGVSSTSSPPTTTSSPPNSATGTKDTTGIMSPRTPTSRGVGTGYKKVTIQSDTSWINRRKQADSKEGTDGSTAAKPATPGSMNTGSQSSTSSITSPTGGTQSSRPHAPYRSHAILPTPSPTTTKSFLTPSVGYGGPPNTVESKSMGPTGKLPPPKLVVNSQTRTESVASAEPSSSKKGGAKGGAADKESQLLRSTSEENFVTAGNSKVKGQSKGGIFGRSGTKKDSNPAKKPSRPWLRGKDKGSPPTVRPQSALITNNGPSGGDRGFTGSCTVSTMPRGPPPEDNAKYSPKSSRRKKAASEQDLYHGRKSKGKFLGRFKNKSGHSGAPPLEEEPEGDSCESSSDDEKGGTIKFKPKLRHVSTVKKPMSFDDDSEPEYHQLFEYVFVVGLKEKPGAKEKGKLTTELTYNFPPASDSAKKDIALQSIPQFCFPDVDQWKPVKEYKSESFSFVLTDMEGHRRYGYCRRLLPEGSGKRLPEVYCIVSPLGCFSLYEKILDNIEERRTMATAVSVFTFLKAIVANPFPRPGRSVEVPVISARGTGMETVVFERPMDSRLEHVDFSLLFNTLSQRKVIQVFSSLLMERRVILCAQSLSLLSGCAHALLALLYPFEWQHVFIPVLPSSLIDFVCSPLPYIIGINPSCIKQIETMETMEEALIVDLDKKKFIRKIGDETSILPTKLFQYLEHSLSSTVVTGEYSKKSSDGAARSRADEVVVNTFMTFFAYLYGDYKSFMSVTNRATGEREFQRKDFLKQFSSKSTKRFLEAFQMTQMFENFIEQRENPSKASMVSESLFEKKFPELSRGCQEIEIFSSKSRFGRWKIKKGLASNS